MRSLRSLICETTEEQKMDRWPQVLENPINLWGMSPLQPSSVLDRCLHRSGLPRPDAVIQATASPLLANASLHACSGLAPPCPRVAGPRFSILDFQSGLHPASASVLVLQQRHALASADLRRVFGFGGLLLCPSKGHETKGIPRASGTGAGYGAGPV